MIPFVKIQSTCFCSTSLYVVKQYLTTLYIVDELSIQHEHISKNIHKHVKLNLKFIAAKWYKIAKKIIIINNTESYNYYYA